MDFNLNMPVRVISGDNCVVDNAELLLKYGKRCLIVTGGKSAAASGALEDCKKALIKTGTDFEVYSQIDPNPRLDSCFEAAQKAVSLGAEFIIGIGGGSPLDAAKAVAVYAANPDFKEEDIYSAEKRNKALPIVLIGTTAGTGSEVSRVSVLTNQKTGRKKSISPEDCYASLAFADSRYTHSMPYGVTVSTALDALAHTLEGYMSPKCTDIPTLFGEKAFESIWKGLKYLYETKEVPDALLRKELYYGSLYAGIVLAYCGTAFPHPLGYILTEEYDVPHGKACAVFMDSFIERCEKFESEKLCRMLSVMKTDKEEFLTVIRSLSALPEVTMTESQVLTYCSRFDNPPLNFKFSPGSFTKEDAVAVFTEKFVK